MADHDEQEKIREALRFSQKGGGRRVVFDKTTGQFKVLSAAEKLDPDRQTEMLPSNIPNAQ